MPRLIFLVTFTGALLSACGSQATNPVAQTTLPVPQRTGQQTETHPVDTLPPMTNPPLPTQGPYSPQPGDSSLLRQEVFLDSTSLRNLNSDPATFVLDLRGNLPSPCNKLRAVVPEPNVQNQIMVDLYSLVNPGEVCIAIIQPFDTSVVLGKFPLGQYTVWVNGQQVGEFGEK
jgi:hypothetical protein